MIKPSFVFLWTTVLFCLTTTVVAQSDSADFYLLSGVEHYNESRYEKAEKALLTALHFANAETPRLSEINTNLGNVYAALGKSEQALQSYQEALRNTDNMSDGKKHKGKILTNIGAMYEEQQDLSKALEYYNQSESIARQVKDTLQIADVLNNRGLVLEQLSRYDEAIALYQEALQYYTALNNIERLTICYNSLGIVSKQQHKLDDAITYYNKAVECAAKLDNDYFVAALMNNVANVYALEKKYDQAISNSLEALSIARSINHLELEQECLGSLSDHYASKGDFQNALRFQKEFQAANDSLINASRAASLAEMETRFDVERKELQIQNLETKTLLQEEENRRKKFFIGLLISLCALVLIGGFLLMRTAKLNQRKRELEIIAATEKQERDRIAQDMHDELGSGISRINWITGEAQQNTGEEVKTKFAHIENIAHQLSSNMRSLIWLLHTGDVTLDVLLSRIRELGGQYEEDFKFHVKMVLPENGKQTMLRQNATRDIFLMFKECMTNIGKHAHASEVSCKVSFQNNNLELVVSDNGKGFQPKEVKLGHGLGNLLRRATGLGGTMKIESDNKETTFRFILPVQNLVPDDKKTIS
ncbi:MAG: tetratricopeptide repeat protein [Flavobacteriales bacterium]